MKKVLFLVVVASVLVVTSASAQFKFGGGLSLNSKAALNNNFEETVGFGLNLRASYFFSNFGVTLGNTAYLPSKQSADIMGVTMDTSVFIDQINAGFLYKFYNANDFSLYGLAGPVLSIGSAKASALDESATESKTEMGVELGLGTNYKKLFGELKYESATKGIIFMIGVNF